MCVLSTLALANAISEEMLMAGMFLDSRTLDFINQDSNDLGLFVSKTSMAFRCLAFHHALAPMDHGHLRANAQLSWAVFNMRLVLSNVLGCMRQQPWKPGK